MPPSAAQHCRVSGCQSPRHIYPNGSRCQYCREHMKYRKASQRGDQPSMTGQMRDVLHYLRQMKADGLVWVALHYPFAHGTVLKGLCERDWIFRSEAVDGFKYKITARGEDALGYYETMINRRDGVCPRCGVAERHVRASGIQDAYCIDCLHLRSAEKRARGGDLGNIHRPCSRCRKRSRHQYPNGRYSTYCKHCETVRRRRNARKERRSLLKRVQAGAPVPVCQICKQHPRKVFPNSISNYCESCIPIQMRKWKLKRALSAHLPYLGK